MSSPFKNISPLSAVWKPEIKSKKVVFPAPLGPIIEVSWFFLSLNKIYIQINKDPVLIYKISTIYNIITLITISISSYMKKQYFWYSMKSLYVVDEIVFFHCKLRLRLLQPVAHFRVPTVSRIFYRKNALKIRSTLVNQ